MNNMKILMRKDGQNMMKKDRIITRSSEMRYYYS